MTAEPVVSFRFMDKALAERLSGMDPSTRDIIVSDMAHLADLAESMQGKAAFVCTREDAALHEAGHAVYEASVGQPISVVKIYHETVGGRRSWLGSFRGRDSWEISPASAPESDLDVARMLIAGWMAEFVCQAGKGRFRTGSSLDEMAMFKGIVATAAGKLSVNHEQLAHQQLAVVGEIILRHEATVRAVAAELIARGSLKGDRLARLLRPVSLARAESAAM